MPRELKGVVIKKVNKKYTVFLENHTKKQAMSDIALQTGKLVWVSYDYDHQRIASLRIRNKN